MDKYAKNTQGSTLQIPVADKTVTTELSGDFTLPDYQPEIKRLLWINAAVLPPSRYIGDRQAELAGSIDYYVLYIGSDGAVYCAPLTTEYKVDMPFEFDIGDIRSLSASTSINPDMISGRVTAPRKISIKCRLKSRISLFGEMAVEDGFAHGEDGVQVLRGKTVSYRTLRGVGEMLRLSDEIICDSRDGEIRVISAEGKVLMSEISPSENSVICRGDLYMKLLLCREEGGAPYTVLRKIPFSQNIAVEGARAGDGAMAKGSVCELNVTVDEGRIGIETEIIIESEVAHGEENEVVRDVYSISKKSDNTYKKIAISSASSCFSGNLTLSDSLPIDEIGITVGARIIDACGTAFVDEYCFANDKCALSGKAKISMLCEKDGELSVVETELPFNYKTSAEGEFTRAMAEAQVIFVRARTDGDRVGIDAEIGFCGTASLVGEEKILDNAFFADDLNRPGGEITVCYPSVGDSLWSVAKKYGVSLDSLCKNNKISDVGEYDSLESLKDVNFLLIS